jgi:hypothetical protein
MTSFYLLLAICPIDSTLKPTHFFAVLLTPAGLLRAVAPLPVSIPLPYTQLTLLPEDGGSMFIRNIIHDSTEHTASIALQKTVISMITTVRPQISKSQNSSP